MRRLGLALALASAMLAGSQARAQGCAQCRDNAAATPPATQLAYRHAIEVLAGAAGLLFAGTLVILRRNR